MSVVVYNPQITDNAVPVLLNQLNQPVDGIIELGILGFAGIGAVILDGYRIGQLAVRKQLSVPIVDVSPGTGHRHLALGLQGKGFLIVTALYNLQKKHPLQKNAKQDHESHAQYKDT